MRLDFKMIKVFPELSDPTARQMRLVLLNIDDRDFMNYAREIYSSIKG